jgi:hypothetical protein
MDDKTAQVKDAGGVGAEGGGSEDKLPSQPAAADDTPLGDSDQHSQVPSPPAQTGS